MKAKILLTLLLILSIFCINSCDKCELNTESAKATHSYLDKDGKAHSLELPSKLNMGKDLNFELGKEIKIAAKYKIIDKSLTYKDLKFQWIMGDKVVGTDSVLVLKNLPVNTYNGLLKIYDSKNNYYYISNFSFTVNPSFIDGLYILSEDKANTNISYLQISANNKGELQSNMRKSVYYAIHNAYIAQDFSEVSAHVYSNNNGALSIIKNDAVGPVDLSCNTMNIIGYAYKDFTQKPDSKIKDIIYAGKDVYALCDNGKVYNRIEETYKTDLVPHISTFPRYPMSIEGSNYEISQWLNCGATANDFMFGYRNFAFDKLNSRIINIEQGKMHPITNEDISHMLFPLDNRINAEGFDGKKTYKDIHFPPIDNFSAYNLLRLTGSGYDVASYETRSISLCLFLQNKENKKIYINTMQFGDQFGLRDIKEDLFFPLPEDLNIDPANALIANMIGSGNNAIFICSADNKDIYYFNLINGTIKKIYHSDNTITAITVGATNDLLNPMNIYLNKLIVAESNSTIKVLDSSSESIQGDSAKVLMTINANIGDIKAIRYMSNTVGAL